MNYIVENKEWIFSGIGVFFLTILFTLIYNKRKEKSSHTVKLKKSNSNTIQLINTQTNFENQGKTETSKEIKDALKEMYRRLDTSIKSIETGLSPIKVNPPKTNAEYLKEAIDNYKSLVEFHDTNDIFFDKEINDTIHKIRDLIFKCLRQQDSIEFCHNMNFRDQLLIREIDKMDEIYETLIKKEIPQLKRELAGMINKYF